MPEMKPVSSSCVESIGWENDTLFVQWKRNGAPVSQYPGVTEEQFNEILASPSIGRAINALKQ